MKNNKNINNSPVVYATHSKIFKNPCASSLPLASVVIASLLQAKATRNSSSSNKVTATTITTKGTPSLNKLSCKSKQIIALPSVAAATTTANTKLTGLSKLLVANLDKKNNWPGLVFLQKRGSSHANPNPNIISYKFPGTKTKTNNSSCSNNSHKSVNNLNRFIINNVYKLLFNFFKSMYCLISKPVFITTQDKIKIQLFYFVAVSGKSQDLMVSQHPAHGSNFVTKASIGKAKLASKLALIASLRSNSVITKVYPEKFKLICGILGKFLNKTVELELIRLHKPYYDSTILVNFLALIINKKNIASCIKKLYDSTSGAIQSPPATVFLPSTDIFNILENSENKKAIDLVNNWLGFSDKAVASNEVTAAYLAGLNIKISGRLMREPIVPRITSKKFEKGFTANGKINYSDVARFTHKNRKGAFSISIKSGQKF